MFVGRKPQHNPEAPLGATGSVGGEPPPRWLWWSRATNMRLRWSQEGSGSDFAFWPFTFAIPQFWPPAHAGGSDKSGLTACGLPQKTPARSRGRFWL